MSQESQVVQIELNEKIKFLKSHPAFQSLPEPQDITDVAEILQHQKCTQGYTFFKQGEEANALFVLQSGEAIVNQSGRNLATLRAGEIFGEMGILSQSPRNATVTATTDCYFFVLPAFSILDLNARNTNVKKFFEDLIKSRS